MESDKNKVLFYGGKYHAFSNFSSFMVMYEDYLWPTAEYAYQASKFDDVVIINEIKSARSSYDTFQIARKYPDKVRKDWMEVNLGIMKKIVREKLNQHSYIKQKLIETGQMEIIENSPTDAFWGWGPNKDGQNHLGKIWMELRDEIN